MYWLALHSIPPVLRADKRRALTNALQCAPGLALVTFINRAAEYHEKSLVLHDQLQNVRSPGTPDRRLHEKWRPAARRNHRHLKVKTRENGAAEMKVARPDGGYAVLVGDGARTHER